MNKARIGILGAAALPLVAVLVAVMVFAFGHTSAPATEADTAPNMTITAPATDSVGGAGFSVVVHGFAGGNSIGSAATEIALQTGLTYTGKACNTEAQIVPEGFCTGPTVTNPPFGTVHALGQGTNALTDIPRPAATSIDPLATINVNCTAKGTFQIVLTVESSDRPAGSLFNDLDDVAIAIKSTGSKTLDLTDDATANPISIAISDSITVDCVNPTATNTPTQTFTPTSTNTPTNTPAAPPILKCVPGTGFGSFEDKPTATPEGVLQNNDLPCSAVQNLWLTRQGEKIPPVNCTSGTDTAEFQVGTDTALTAPDPKGGGKIQDLGAFEFEVNYDENKICVELEKGIDSNEMKCFIEHDANPNQTLEGVARIGCVTLGKPLIVDGVWVLTMTTVLLGDEKVITCLGAIESPTDLSSYGLPFSKLSQGADFQTDVHEEPKTPFGCNNSTIDSFGWIAHPGTAFLGDPSSYDPDTGQLDGFIPCPEDSICTADGSVTGKFTQNKFTGTATIVTLLGELTFDLQGVRVARIPADDLAHVIVRPQPEVYSQARPNQDNGVVVQLNNLKCELADLQGHAINVFSCQDADVTIRYLEGDVNPDCDVGVTEAQNLAFRWGAQKGSLLYNDFFNLEPSGAQSDNDIDIKDLQFVFGRLGSTCDDAHPAQNPVNKKA